MTDKLQEICDRKRADLALAKEATPLATLEKKLASASPVRGFAKALQGKVARGGFGLIAEIKKASPSAGLIRPDFDPSELARSYEKGGAACLSVLTDTPFFQGCNDYLTAARDACSLPVLRKDFMLDAWQIVESRAIGADCILLIMAALDDKTALDLHKTATDLDMDVLIEVHSKDELSRALDLPSGLIGINNRNLKTLKIDLTMTEDLAPLVPKNRLLVGESGIATREDLLRLAKSGVSCFLIGESLMRQKDVTKATRRLLTQTI
jgi:indole-3-glycerol phosphate synthase